MASSRNLLFDIYEVQDLLFLALFLICFYYYVNLVWSIRYLLIKSWNYPGPFNLPLIGNAYMFLCKRENILDRLTQMQEKYPMGVKIWMGYKLIYSFHEPEQIKKILGNGKFLTKEKLFYDHFTVDNMQSIFTSPPEQWKKNRRMIVPSFNQQILNSLVEVFARKSLVLNEILADNCGRELDCHDILGRCVLDTTCESIMGVKTDEQNRSSDYAHAINRIVYFSGLKVTTFWYRLQMFWSIFGYAWRVNACEIKLKDLCNQIIHQKKNTINKEQLSTASNVEVPLKRMPFLDHIKASGQLSEEQFAAEIGAILIGAVDTSSTVLSFVFTVLGMFPDIQQKVYEEVTGILGNDRSPEFTDLPQMLYTERVIKETLRLFPVAPLFLRAVTENVDMGKFVIPKGASAGFGLMFIHRNPKYWPDPLKFDPDRFLPEEVAKRHPCTYIPFSFGPRNCIGRTYGMMNMKVLLATVIRKFIFHSGYKKIEDIRVKFDLLINFQDGAKVSMTPRQ